MSTRYEVVDHGTHTEIRFPDNDGPPITIGDSDPSPVTAIEIWPFCSKWKMADGEMVQLDLDVTKLVVSAFLNK